MSNKPAAISASLVDVRNIAAHKCVRLEIHVPAEEAPLVMEAFGWPTMVDPVPVAIARLANVTSIKPQKERQPFEDLKETMQAVLRCKQPAFWTFLREKYRVFCHSEESAAGFVRDLCGVESRKGLNLNPKAAARWIELDEEFQLWLREPQHA